MPSPEAKVEVPRSPPIALAYYARLAARKPGLLRPLRSDSFLRMASPAPQRMTLAAFLEWDDGTDRRYQLVDGVPAMMAPATEAHGELAAALAMEIRSRLEQPYRVRSVGPESRSPIAATPFTLPIWP
jgi:hypothetical protein